MLTGFKLVLVAEVAVPVVGVRTMLLVLATALEVTMVDLLPFSSGEARRCMCLFHRGGRQRHQNGERRWCGGIELVELLFMQKRDAGLVRYNGEVANAASGCSEELSGIVDAGVGAVD